MQNSKSRTLALLLGAASILAFAGCASTPMGPTVQVMPGQGKSFDSFAADQTYCKQYASQQVAGQADVANKQAVGAAALTTGLGAALGGAFGGGTGAGQGAATGAATGAALGAGQTQVTQATIQQQYDNAYAQCMYAKHDQVAGWEPPAAPTSPNEIVPRTPHVVRDPLVADIQKQLIRLGLLSGSADGVMGPRTRAAIGNYERTKGMPVDGEPSEALLDDLKTS